MPWAKQAPETTKRPASAVWAMGLGLVVLISGCSVGSKGASDIDAGLTTASIAAPTSPAPNTEDLADQTTVRNAVTSLDLGENGGKPLAWANDGTGSRGSITAIAETKRDGVTCRKFITTRESFSGVALYNGQACSAVPGAWYITEFTSN